jgi:8-oxo-dGTP pyrophosphatase MutT (NUDIX family)
MGEADFDGVFSFVGGKMENSDKSILAGLSREKNEEVGKDATIKICPELSYNILFRKKDGNSMILPHYIAVYEKGAIRINTEEYSEYRWVSLDGLKDFNPKIETIPTVVDWATGIKPFLGDKRFVRI